MNTTTRGPAGVRDLLAGAEQAAAARDSERALALFGACVGEYLRKRLPFKAIAVSRKAKTLLGPLPKVSSLIIRAYREAGLEGDARSELEHAAATLHRDRLGFFSALDDEAFVALLEVMDVVRIPKGKTVLRRFDAGNDVFVILAGSCEILRDDRRLSMLKAGDVFGEIGFFSRGVRTATVKTLEDSTLLRIPAGPLQDLQEFHLCLRQVLESVYSERIMKKVTEDLEEADPSAAAPEIIATLRYAKGQDIPVHPRGSVAVLKHGIVEMDYDNLCLRTKRYLKPGSIIDRKRGRARASTNVVIMLTNVLRRTP
ncbi:MAG TPA: cyclic nucleotide-binding domain-containing protein [Deltaproteobacteria bacterium]|nr:cyclic nucleotide-binding domain-containing protein [Deltaproteobacteria bacterium]